MVTGGLRADAVFEGGGVKGIGLVGAVAVAEEKGYRWSNVAGTSAGAIVACLVAAGYSAAELKQVMAELDYNKFKDSSLMDRVPVVGPLSRLIFEKGIYEGKYFESWIKGLLLKKNIRTFGDLVMDEFKNDERYRFKLRVIASDISRGRMLVLPQDISDYGVRPEDLSVAAAIRMSMSIPFFFEPVTIANMKTHPESYVVDGGVLSNFPLWLFDTDGGEPGWPTIGFKLVEPEEQVEVAHKVRGPISLLAALFGTMMEAHDARYIKDENFVRTIPIPTLGVGTTEFNITRERSEALYQSGRDAAEKFFSTWNFTDYVNRYRRGKRSAGRSQRLRPTPGCGPRREHLLPGERVVAPERLEERAEVGQRGHEGECES
ncbi:MAG: patatin-like phospholipase family protein [Dehalococcoidales bacterium]|nr:patatin-like phospholipase family protein [Dehalococcoidales bacterium]